jgi:L-arabinose isomerase
VTREFLEDFAEMAGIELLTIGKETGIQRFKMDIRLGEVAYQ